MATQTWVANYERLKNKDWLMATLWEQLLDVRYILSLFLFDDGVECWRKGGVGNHSFTHAI